MDLARKVQYFTLDVISEIGFGQTFGDLKADADLNDYAQSSEEGLFFLTVAASLGINWLLHIPLVARLLGPSEKDKSGFGKMMATARKLIDERVKGSTDSRSDMLASFIRHGMTKDELFSESLLQILAGSDTTATAIRGIMLYLITHPRVYSKLQSEIDAGVKQGRAPESPGIISDAEARGFEYLQAVVKEGIRIYPPVTDLLSKRVPDKGDTVVVEGKSVFLPGGTNVGYAAWPMHHSKSVYGDDADIFRPERWMLEDNEKNREKLAVMHRTSEMIFGYGKYQCLGKPIARMEIGKAIFEVSEISRFDTNLMMRKMY
jgi:cytochrome P450